MKKYCIDCGFENASDDKFCRNCGKKLVDIEPSEKPKKDEAIKKKPESKTPETKAKVMEPRKEPIIEETPKYKISEIPPRKIKPITSKASTKDMSKKILMMASIAIILSIVAIVIAFVIQPSVEIGEETIGTDEIKNNAVTGNEVLDGSLTDADITNTGISKIAANSITGNMILSNSITFDHLSDDVVTSITGQVNISNNSITSEKILNGEVKTEDLADDSITSAKIKDGEITEDDIATNAVGYPEIKADAVRTSELIDEAVTYDKMAIKIKCKLEENVENGSLISHGLPTTPTSVVVTPVYDSSILGGDYVLYANVYSVGSSSFRITLHYEETGNGASTINEVDGISPWDTIDVYWIAIYAPA